MKKQKKKEMDQIVCPSCGRYVGPYETCPYCGANLKKRMSIRIFKYFAIFYSLVGLFLLYITAVYAKTPIIKIKDISSTMNFAHIRLKGIISRDPKFHDDSKSLILKINDSTGSISVAMFKDVAETVYKKYDPALGDVVDVEGSLRIKDKFTSLNITSPDNFSLTKSQYVFPTSSDKLEKFINKKVVLTGKIISISQYKKFVPIILVWNKTKIKIPIYKNKITPDIRQLTKFSIIQVKGFLTKNNDVLTLAPIEIKLLEKSTTSKIVKIKNLSQKQLKQRVKIKGMIKKVYSIKKGKKLIVSDDTGSIMVIVWDSVGDKLSNSVKLEKDKSFIFKGMLKEYKGKLEIIPQYPDNIIPLRNE